MAKKTTKKSPTKVAKKKASAASKAAGPIAPTSPNYPKYVVQFSGGNLTTPIKVTGPHTFALLQPGGGTLTVSLKRNPADPGRPNLGIKFT
jgi:hypothetical protein